jgi:hypothetical protein
MSKTFTHAGVSTLDGVTKARFCNDALRQKVLIKNGHTNIDIVELMSPMTKEDAVAALLKANFANGNAVVQAALEAEVEKRAPKAGNKDAPKKEVKKPKKAPAPKPSLDAIKARGEAVKKAVTKAQIEAQLADLEDAPY